MLHKLSVSMLVCICHSYLFNTIIDLDIVYRVELNTIIDDSMARLLTNSFEPVNLIDIPIVTTKELIANSSEYVRILIKILGYFTEEELLALSQTCRLWKKIVFIQMMSKAFKYEKHQVQSFCYNELIFS